MSKRDKIVRKMVEAEYRIWTGGEKYCHRGGDLEPAAWTEGCGASLTVALDMIEKHIEMAILSEPYAVSREERAAIERVHKAFKRLKKEGK